MAVSPGTGPAAFAGAGPVLPAAGPGAITWSPPAPAGGFENEAQKLGVA